MGNGLKVSQLQAHPITTSPMPRNAVTAVLAPLASPPQLFNNLLRCDHLFGRLGRLFDQRRDLFGMREKCDMASGELDRL